MQPNFQLKQPLPSIANEPDANKHPVLVRTGTGDFYEDLAFRFTGPVQLARDGRLGDRLIKTDYNNFAPRLGIAYSPSAKWSFRTGFGVFFSQESKNSIFDMSRAAGGRANPPIDLQGVPTLTYQNFINTSQLPVSFAPGLTWGADYNLPHHVHDAVSVQHAADARQQLDTGGRLHRQSEPQGEVSRQCERSHTRHHAVRRSRAISGMARHSVPRTATASATTTRSAAKLTQRFGASLTTMFSYTWSKALDENSAIRGTGSDFTLMNQRCRSCDYGPAGFNIPHRFVASVLYALPFGKGQPFLNHGGVAQSDHRRLAAEHDHDHPERHVDQSGILGLGRHGRGLPALEPAALRRRVNPVAENPTSGSLLRSRSVPQRRSPASSATAAATA